MMLSAPNDRAYYFEITPRSTRLIYYVPFKELSVLVRKRLFRIEVVQDFPYGFEVDVSHSEYRLCLEEYGFIAPVSPDLIWAAFRGFWLHSNKTEIVRTGILNARRLEAYASRLRAAIDEFDHKVRRSGVSDTRGIERSTERQTEQPPVWSELRDKVLLDISPKDSNSQLTLDQQMWSKVRMSRGKSATEVFSTIEFPSKRGKHGSS
jgi:hypothetical protein